MHSKEVSGLGVDSLNKYLVSGSLDGTVKLWDFYRKKLVRTFENKSESESLYPVLNLTYNRFNDLVAFSSADLSLTLLSVRNNLQKVRHLPQAAQN